MENQMHDADNLSSVKHIILVLSGKGGVGKSTIASQIAISLKNCGNKVGLLDIDLCGPSIPRMFNMEDKDVHQCSDGWVPIFIDSDQSLGVMSIGFLLKNKDDAVVWRGPKKNAMIKQFLSDVYWRNLDYLIIDTPPGTSDEHITVVENLKKYQPDGAVLVTTPQAVSVADVRRELSFCKQTKLPVIGIVENMSGFSCPHCKECSNIFSTGGGEALANQFNIPFLGKVPLDPKLTRCLEDGKSFLAAERESPTKDQINKVVQSMLKNIEKV